MRARHSRIGLPLVDRAGQAAVFLGAHQLLVLVVLGPGHLTVSRGRDLNACELAVWPRIGPRIDAAVVTARESDFLERVVVAVVFPAVDLPVAVLVDLDAKRTSAVHVGPGVELAVVVRIEGELRELAGVFGVGRLGAWLGLALAAARGGQGRQEQEGGEQERLSAHGSGLKALGSRPTAQPRRLGAFGSQLAPPPLLRSFGVPTEEGGRFHVGRSAASRL
jgi:hypothetical protein